MIKFHRQYKFYETELCPKISNKHPWKVKDFLSLENLTGLYKPVKPVWIRPWILKSFNNLFVQKFIVFTVNEHESICMAGLNRQAGYATAQYSERE